MKSVVHENGMISIIATDNDGTILFEINFMNHNSNCSQNFDANSEDCSESACTEEEFTRS